MTIAYLQPLRSGYKKCSHVVVEFPKATTYGLLFSLFLVWLLIRILTPRKRQLLRRENTPDLEKPASRRSSTFKAPERPPGVWTPVDFKRPTAPPYPNWDVRRSEPIPYRPFRHGPYHITMGLRTMQWDEWIELDNHYTRFHEDKKRRIADRGEKCCRTAPEAFDGAIELLEEL